MQKLATAKNYGKKKGSDHFRDILNPYGENQLWKNRTQASPV
jgi:hypothetical protein